MHLDTFLSPHPVGSGLTVEMRLMSKDFSGPTPSDCTLYPRRAKTPVTTSNTPGLFITTMEMVCGVYLALGSSLGMSPVLFSPGG